MTKWHKSIAGARKTFQHPTTLVKARKLDDMRGCYCVGGAICQSMGRMISFPGISALSWALFQINPNLKGRLSDEFAEAVIQANDKGDFDTAWAKANEACLLGGPRRDRLSQLTAERK